MQTTVMNKHVRFTFLLALVLLSCVSCQKSVDQPAPQFVQTEISGFRISESKMILLEGNANNKAVSFAWAPLRAGDTYTIEADVSEDNFSDPIEIANTSSTNASFTVAQFNTLMCRLLCAENSGKIDFRVKTSHGFVDIYSPVTAINVTTYRNYINYDDSKTLKVPGNYQGWNVATAPKIVSAKTAGEYEGFMDFENPSPQVLLVKGNQWDLKNTFTYIGNNMFGFGGSIIDVQGGAGVYLFRASTNTNRWSSTKINSWNLAGSAVQGNSKTVMADNDDASLSWSITTDLVAGSFRINANNGNTISFGHKDTDQPGVPSYDGADLQVKRAGNYTITLKLGNAGNYGYTIRRNS